MNLTDQQIEKLYTFTRKHYVEHYDLQTELVDHLANDIEAMQEEDASLTFEAAKSKSFKKFGVMGFSDVVDQKKKEMTKKYWKILWGFLKEWFTIPKIIMTAVIFLGIYYGLRFDEGRVVLALFFLILIVVGFVFDVIVNYKIKQRKKRKQRIFLMEEIIVKTKFGMFCIVLINVSNIFNIIKVDFHTLSFHWVALCALGLTVIFITFIITEFTIPNKAEELLKEQYPEYNFV